MHTIEPAAHGGVEAEVPVLDQDLAILEVFGLGDGLLLGLEGLSGDDLGLGALGQDDGEVLFRHVGR